MNDIKLFIICGRARNGKDTLADILKEKLELRGKKVCKIPLMRTLKGYIKDYFGWDGCEDTKPRELLQKFGTDIIRVKLNKPLFHIDRLTEDIEILSEFFDTFIIDDARFPEEIEVLRDRFKNVTVIHIEKDGVNALSLEQEKHISEVALDNYTDYDYDVKNNGTIEDLKNIIDKILEGDNL